MRKMDEDVEGGRTSQEFVETGLSLSHEDKYLSDNPGITIPKALQRPDLKFVRLIMNSERTIESWRQGNFYRFDDPVIQSHIAEGKNYGVVCQGLIVLKIFDDKISVDSLPETFTVRTPTGELEYYFICPEVSKPIRFFRESEIALEVLKDKHVVGPDCKTLKVNIKTGEIETRYWEVERDCEIAEISLSELKEFLDAAGCRVEWLEAKPEVKEPEPEVKEPEPEVKEAKPEEPGPEPEELKGDELSPEEVKKFGESITGVTLEKDKPVEEVDREREEERIERVEKLLAEWRDSILPKMQKVEMPDRIKNIQDIRVIEVGESKSKVEDIIRSINTILSWLRKAKEPNRANIGKAITIFNDLFKGSRKPPEELNRAYIGAHNHRADTGPLTSEELVFWKTFKKSIYDILLNKYSTNRLKMPKEFDWSGRNNYAPDDPTIVRWCEIGGNYGIALGFGGLICLDEDVLGAFDEEGIFETIPRETLVNSTGKGRHFLYKVEEIDELKKTFGAHTSIKNKAGEVIGDLKVGGKGKTQIVGPGSLHPSGRRYEIAEDREPVVITIDQIRQIMNRPGAKEPQVESISKATTGEKKNKRWADIKIEEAIKPKEISSDDGDTIRCTHPVHGSKSGSNLVLKRSTNEFYCHRCKSGGGPLEWFAIESGVVECGETKRGWYKKLNRGERKKIDEHIKSRGFNVPHEMINKDSMGLSWQVQSTIERMGYVSAVTHEVLVYSNTLVRVIDGEIEVLNRESLPTILDRMVPFIKVDNNGITHSIYPPKEVVIGILTQRRWPELPTLKGVSRAPIVRDDFSIAQVPGYDKASQWYYAGKEMELPEHVSLEEAMESKEFLDEFLFSNFKFEDETSKANAWFFIYAGLMRNLFPYAPFFYISKPDVSSGASTLSMFPSLICTGTEGAILSNTGKGKSGNEEINKRLDTSLLKGERFITLDNQNDVRSEYFNTFATSPTVDIRILGESKSIKVPNNYLISFNGIHLIFSEDTARRGILIELQPNSHIIKDPEKEIVQNLKSNRELILWHMLRIVIAWREAGMPRGEKKDIRQLVTFAKCVEVIDPILQFVGVTESLRNINKPKEDTPDTEMDDIFILVWGIILKKEKISTPFLIETLANRIPSIYIPAEIKERINKGDSSQIGYSLRKLTRKKVGLTGPQLLNSRSRGVTVWWVEGWERVSLINPDLEQEVMRVVFKMKNNNKQEGEVQEQSSPSTS